MPLNLVLGPANSAKAGEVLGAYALAARRDALLVVPTRADAVHYERELAAPGVTLGRAITFPGLIDEIASRSGNRMVRLTPLQREQVLRDAIRSLRLDSLAAPSATDGFVRAAGRLIAELEQGRTDPARFISAMRAWAGGSPERARYGRELGAIYRRYTEQLEQLGRVDSETFAWGALDALREHPDRWGATPVFLYGYDDLTPIELDAIETLALRVGAPVTVSLTYEPDRPALAARASVVEELRGLARSVVQLPPRDAHYAPGSRAALHHLERHLFQGTPPVVDPGDAVTLLEAGGRRAEAELVTAEVLAALRGGVAGEEIVVVCRSLGVSAQVFERALQRQGVPTTSDRRVPLAHTALGRALTALVRAALQPAQQRSVEDLVAFLRHPGLVEPMDAVDRLEADLRRSRSRRVLETSLRLPALAPAVAQLEELRRDSDPLDALARQVRLLLQAPHRRRAHILNADEQLDARAATTVLDALEQLRELDSGGAVPMTDVSELLESLQVPANGPAVEGAVLVAEPLAIRARRFRRVFVTGLCEGEFPSPQTRVQDPLLGDERRRELALASGLVLAQSQDPLDRERYLLYSCVSRASERVTFSYRSSDEDGNVVIASPFLDDVAELFCDHWPQLRRRRLLADVVWSVEEAPSERDREIALAFEGAASEGREEAATRVLSERALAHVRHRRVVSAGALETFAACPLKWLVERQLKLQRLEPDPDPLVRGSFIHAVLERVFARLGAGLTSRTLPQALDLLGEEVAGSGEHAAALAAGQPPPVRAAILRGIEAELRRYLVYEAAGGCAWPPLRTELRFGLDDERADELADARADAMAPDELADAMAPVELRAGSERVLLSGIVDRVDADPSEPGRVIVRDYKSGARRDSWPAARWTEDRQIQVALYMIAVRRLLGVQPVAGFYQPLAGEDLRPRGAFVSGADVGANTLPRDAMSDGELEGMLREIEAEAVALAATLGRGELTPCPETCSPDGTCRYPGICWAER